MTLRLALTLCLLSLLAASQGPIETNRPGQADPPKVLPPGVAQVESGLRLERESDETPTKNTLTWPQLELRLGVIPRLELQLSADGLVQEWREGQSDETGGGDLELDARLRLWDQAGWRPAAAVELGLSFPVGSDFATSGGFDPEGDILFAWQLEERFTLIGNLDFASETQGDDDSSRHFVFRPELSLDIALGERQGAFVEYFGNIEESAGDQHSFGAGVTFLLTKNLQLDLSGGAGVTDAAPDFFIEAGFAWRLPRLWE